VAVTLCQGCGAEYADWSGTCPACGSTASLKVSRKVDQMLGRLVGGTYRVLKKLGQGGMGAVYLGENQRLDQKVALKFLNASLVNEPDIVRRFLNEAKTYGRLAHPNAVTVLDLLQEEDETLCIVMEYVEGSDLRRVISERGRLTPAEAIDIALQAADVLQLAHAKGIVHRDLKPENIMVRPGLRGHFAKVLDFGIARLLHDNASRLTAQGAIAGTPRYMPPEQVEGRDVDARADIYALGIVVFEMLTGRVPFDGVSISEILHHQVSSPMPHLWEVDPTLQFHSLDDVLQRATRKLRVERYPSMQAFAQDLSNAVPTLVSIPAPLPVAPAGPVAVVPTGGGTLSYGSSPTLASARTDLALAAELFGGTGTPSDDVEVQTFVAPVPGSSLPSVVASPSLQGAAAALGQQGLPPTDRRSVAPDARPTERGEILQEQPVTASAAPARGTLGPSGTSEPVPAASAPGASPALPGPSTAANSAADAGPVDPFTKTVSPRSARSALGTAPAPGRSKVPLIAGGVGLAAAALVAVRLLGGPAAPGPTASSPTVAAPQPAARGAEQAAAGSTSPGTPAPGTASAQAGTVQPPAAGLPSAEPSPPAGVVVPSAGAAQAAGSATGNTSPQPPSPAQPVVPAAAQAEVRPSAEAREGLRRARRAWEDGRLTAARDALEDMPADGLTAAERKVLLGNVTEALQHLAQGRSQLGRGECSGAMAAFGAVLRLNPRVAEAVEGREKCKRMLPPAINE
jgi:serine/threonine protein kinase